MLAFGTWESTNLSPPKFPLLKGANVAEFLPAGAAEISARDLDGGSRPEVPGILWLLNPSSRLEIVDYAVYICSEGQATAKQLVLGGMLRVIHRLLREENQNAT
jgi:hypothetical protein